MYEDKSKFGNNTKTALFIISGEKTNIGEILCINNEVTELFGYDKLEMMNYNISKVMPPIISSKHSQFILNFFKSQKLSKSSDRLVFPLHKFGYIIPCEIGRAHV